MTHNYTVSYLLSTYPTRRASFTVTAANVTEAARLAARQVPVGTRGGIEIRCTGKAAQDAQR